MYRQKYQNGLPRYQSLDEALADFIRISMFVKICHAYRFLGKWYITVLRGAISTSFDEFHEAHMYHYFPSISLDTDRHIICDILNR